MADTVQKPEILVLDADTMVVNSRLTDYESFTWTHNWYGIDEWTIKINRYKNGVDLLDEEGYIAYKNLEGTWSVGIIGKITKPGGADGKASEQWEITGIGIEGIFNHRPCMNDFANSTTDGYTVLKSMAIETAMRQIVNQECIAATNASRDLPGLSLNIVDYERPASNVVLDLRFDGASGSTTFKDSSQYNKTITVYGAASISTAQYKFNSSSGYFNGTDAYLTVPAIDLSKDWSWSGWFYPTFAGQTGIIMGQPPGIGAGEVFLSSGLFYGSVYGIISIGGVSCSINTWHYGTVSKIQIDSTHWLFTAWLDGVQVGQTTITTNTLGSNLIYIGDDLRGFYFNGYMADYIITNSPIDGTIVPTTQFVDPYVADKSCRTDTVASILEDLCKQSGVSYRLTWTGTANGLTDRKLFQFDVLEGNDLSSGSNAVKLSVEFGNLLTYEYVRSVLEKKNYIFVGGSGDGAARILASAFAEDTEPSGWSRRESFYDSSDSTTAAQAQAAGIVQLGTLGDTQTLTFTYNYLANSYKYGTHFKLGDIVVAQVADVAAVTARITQVIETYNENGKSIGLTMGTSSVDLVSILKAQIRAVRKLGAH